MYTVLNADALFPIVCFSRLYVAAGKQNTRIIRLQVGIPIIIIPTFSRLPSTTIIIILYCNIIMDV